MRKSFGAKPLCYPQPVFIIAAYDENGAACAMNAAWGGISDDAEISMCLSPSHRTVKNILETGAFTVSMATEKFTAECDYLGVASGNKVPDKLEKCGFHTEKAGSVNAPVIAELPMTIECRLKSYDPESCRMVGEIVDVTADESILTGGNIDPQKLRPIIFDSANRDYLAIGAKVGNAFEDGMKIK